MEPASAFGVEPGRPKDGAKPGTQDSAMGRDPLGTEIRSRESKLKTTTNRRLSKESNMAIAKKLLKKSKNLSILNENNLLDDKI